MRLQLGDVVRLKKAHPCGSDRWEILRTGMDFRLRCLGCGHLVMIPRSKLERRIREVQAAGSAVPRAPGAGGDDAR